MTSRAEQESSQTDLFSQTRAFHDAHPEFAEICNALYERELLNLAFHGPAQLTLMRRKLKGLPHYVRRAAYYLADNTAPIAIDAHNASWQAKQAAKSPARTPEPDKTAAWFSSHAALGLVVCIRVQGLDVEHIELDSVDKVQPENQTLHTNKHGWFSYDGDTIEPSRRAHTQYTLLKPGKVVMTAACCGHTWNHRGKTSPRALSLREMLLSTTIDWKHFRVGHRAQY